MRKLIPIEMPKVKPFPAKAPVPPPSNPQIISYFSPSE